MLILVATTGCISIDLLGSGSSEPLEESVVAGDEGPKVLLLEIDSVSGRGLSPRSGRATQLVHAIGADAGKIRCSSGAR